MLKYGNNTIRIRKIDATLPGGNLMKFSPLTPFIYAAARLIADIKNLFKHKKSLNINIFTVPAYIVSLMALRIIYFFGMSQELLSNARP